MHWQIKSPNFAIRVDIFSTRNTQNKKGTKKKKKKKKEENDNLHV